MKGKVSLSLFFGSLSQQKACAWGLFPNSESFRERERERVKQLVQLVMVSAGGRTGRTSFLSMFIPWSYLSTSCSTTTTGSVALGIWFSLTGGSGNCSARNNGNGGLWFSGYFNGLTIAVTAMAGVVLAAVLFYSRRGSLKSPWSRRKRKHALSPQQWKNLFSPDGKFLDGGVKFLKKVRSGGVDPGIRAEVWPFLLGVYDLNSTKAERNVTRTQKRKEYENLRRQCRHFLKSSASNDEDSVSHQDTDSPHSEDVVSARQSLSSEEERLGGNDSGTQARDESCMTEEDRNGHGQANNPATDTESSDTESSIEEEIMQMSPKENSPVNFAKLESLREKHGSRCQNREDFATWQRIIRLDAVRTNVEWVAYAPAQAEVLEERARRSAEAVGLKDYEHLEPCRIYHAARLVAVLEAYAVYDLEIGYCQGMSDLLSPIIAVMEEDHEAFWCFVGFMKNARHNFRLDEVGIRRQLSIVSKIIRFKDSHLYRHLEKLQAEDCFFVYRMVVVMFRRELSFEQTLWLWEVMWADQAAIRAGIGKSAWARIRQRPPPTNDLLLYAIAACVLRRRKLIIEKYSSMEEIIRECNDMAGQLDVWKLLDDAHDLVVTLHDKV